MANVSSSNGLEKYPKLRFKGFSEPWSIVEFRNLFSYIPNNTLSRAELNYENGEYQNIHYGDVLVKFGAILDADAEQLPFITEGQRTKLENMLLQDGDVIIADTAEDETVGKATEIINIGSRKVVSGLHTFACRPLIDMTPTYLGYYINSEFYHKQLFSLMQGVKVLSISKSNIEDTLISYPHRTEQDKICSFLNLIEAKIDKQKHLVELLKKYKRGALQHIFHEMTDCSIVTVGDVFNKANKRNSDGRIKNVITNSAEYGLIPQRDFFDKDIAVDGNTNNYYIIKKGCFVYNPRKSNTAPYGPFNCYQGEEEGIISPLYTCLVKKADVDSTYLSWYFKSDSWYRYIYDNGSQGVRHDRVSMTDDLLMGIPIKLPNDEKQKEIGAFFDVIDAKLKCETDILNALIKVKNGLYNTMFI